MCFVLLVYAKQHILGEKGKIGSGCCISPFSRRIVLRYGPGLSVRSFQLSRHSVQFQGKETLDGLLRPASCVPALKSVAAVPRVLWKSTGGLLEVLLVSAKWD